MIPDLEALSDEELKTERDTQHSRIDAAYWRFCRMARAKPPSLEVPDAYVRRNAADAEINRRRELGRKDQKSTDGA